jgi:hypothetical protein
MDTVEFEVAAGLLVVDAAGIPAANPSNSEGAAPSTVDTPTHSAMGVASASGGKAPSAPAEVTVSDSQAGPVDKPTVESGDTAADVSAEMSADVTSDVDVKPENGSDITEPEHSGKMVSYHRDSDLYIRIRDSPGTVSHYKVCFALLAAASPALSELVNSKKLTLSRGGKLAFDLADLGDDSHGLDIVLSIIHYKFHEIPSRPDVDLLYSIAQVAEKFNCAHLLVPYMEKWYVHARSSRQDGDRATDLAGSLVWTGILP